MAETREEFRKRIWRTFEIRQYRYPEVSQSYAAHVAGAEAVYATALRDFHEYTFGLDAPDGRIIRDHLAIIAAECGIDLEA